MEGYDAYPPPPGRRSVALRYLVRVCFGGGSLNDRLEAGFIVLGFLCRLRRRSNLVPNPIQVAEYGRRPDAVQVPALREVDTQTEKLPLDRVLDLLEARHVAEHPRRDHFRLNRMAQGQVDAEPLVSPMHVA